MWASAAHPRPGLTPMIPTPSVDPGTRLFTSANAMRLDLDLDVDLFAHEEAARLDHHVPGHPPVLAIDPRLRRGGQHWIPLHVRPPPEELGRKGDGPRDVFDRQIAVELEPHPARQPHGRALERPHGVLLGLQE